MNWKQLSLLLPLFTMASILNAQSPLVTKDSETTFFSHAPLEDIEALNKRTTAAINLQKGEIVVKMLIKHFEFENALMQEHFNENYMESNKFPAAIFKGSFPTDNLIDPSQPGEYAVEVSGELTIHGVTKPLNCTAVIMVTQEQITATTEFVAQPADFDIEIPSVVVKNIAEEITVTSVLVFSKSQ